MGEPIENVEKSHCFLKIIAREFRLNANEPLAIIGTTLGSRFISLEYKHTADKQVQKL